MIPKPSRPGSLAALTLLSLLVPALVARGGPRGPDEAPPPTRFGADVSIYLDQYDVEGPRTQSPFQFTGLHSYGQVNLRFEHRLNPYHVWRGHLSGIVNDSDYRSPHKGAVTERLNLFEENGTARLPYRFELGDTYAFFSQRTVQRTLKGGQIEIQAPLGSGGARHSFQVMSGLTSPTWRELRLRRDFTTGISYLLQAPKRGQIGIVYLDNIRERSLDFFDFRRDQRLVSLAGQTSLGGDLLVLEGEVSHLDERRTLAEGLPETNTNDEGIYLQAGGRTASRIFYRLRYESFGENYDPAGSPIISDRRSGEAYLGWRSTGGLDLRGRFLHYRDFWESPNPLETTTAGLTVSGPLLATRSVTGVLDVFLLDEELKDESQSDRTATAALELARTGAHSWTPRLRVFLQERDDRTGNFDDETTSEVRIGSDHAVRFAGFRGTFGPAVLLRRVRDHLNSTDDVFPAIALNLVRGRHSLRQNLDLLRQDRRARGVEDVETLGYHLVYRFSAYRDDFGVEIDSRDRDPSFGSSTRSLRAGVYWTRRFEHSARARRAPAPPAPSLVAPPAAPGEAARSDRFALTELRPGLPMEVVRARLEELGIREASGTSGVTTYETTLEPGIPLRQQLVLVEDEGVLARAAIVFLAAEELSSADFLQTFERFRRTALDRFGRSDTFLEEGDPGTNLVETVNRGTFYRLMEWTVEGGRLRFGIPRRLDSRLTFELQIAKTFPPERDPLWAAIDLRK